MNASVQSLIDEWQDRGSALEVPGANTRIWREGSGEAVVCLHGVPSSAFLYRKVLPELAVHGLQGIALDFPGLGLADRPKDFDYSWSGLSAWLQQALDAAGIERFHLVVHDIGGPIGFDLLRRLADSPQRVQSLTVMNSIVRVASFHRPWAMKPFAIPVVGRLWLQLMRTPMMIRQMREMGVHLGPEDDELRVYQQLLFREDGGRAFLKIMRGFELNRAFEKRIVDALVARSFPAQIIWGMDDPALPESHYIRPFLDVLDLEEWHNVHGKHFLQEDAPKDIAHRIARIANETEPSTSQWSVGT